MFLLRLQVTGSFRVCMFLKCLVRLFPASAKMRGINISADCSVVAGKERGSSSVGAGRGKEQAPGIGAGEEGREGAARANKQHTKCDGGSSIIYVTLLCFLSHVWPLVFTGPTHDHPAFLLITLGNGKQDIHAF